MRDEKYRRDRAVVRYQPSEHVCTEEVKTGLKNATLLTCICGSSDLHEILVDTRV